VVELCLAFGAGLPIGGLQSVTAWHCLSLLIRVMSVNVQGVYLLVPLNEDRWKDPCIK
jgi:uncharacterized protein YpbB